MTDLGALNVTLRRHSLVVKRPLHAIHMPALERLAMAWLGAKRVIASERRDAVVFARYAWPQRHMTPATEKSEGRAEFSLTMNR